MVFYAEVLAQPKSGVYVPTKRDTISKNQEVILVDLLNSSLRSLSDQDRQGHLIGGYVLLGLGAASAAGGVVTLAVGEGDDARIVGYLLPGGNVLQSGLSLVPFKS